MNRACHPKNQNQKDYYAQKHYYRRAAPSYQHKHAQACKDYSHNIKDDNHMMVSQPHVKQTVVQMTAVG